MVCLFFCDGKLENCHDFRNFLRVCFVALSLPLQEDEALTAKEFLIVTIQFTKPSCMLFSST